MLRKTKLCFVSTGGPLDIDRRKLLAPSGEEIPLTTGEFDMLSAFVRHAGRVLSRERLMDLTRNRSLEAFDRTIDAQIARLRSRPKRSDPDQVRPRGRLSLHR